MLKKTTKAIVLIALTTTALTACATNETAQSATSPQSEQAATAQSDSRPAIEGAEEIAKTITEANTASGVFNADGERKTEKGTRFGEYIQIDLSNAFKPENIKPKLNNKEVQLSELFADEAEMNKMLKDAQKNITEIIDGQYARKMNIPVIKDGEATPGFMEYATKAFPGVNPEDGMTRNASYTINDEENSLDYDGVIDGRLTKDDLINRMEQREIVSTTIPFGGPFIKMMKNDGIEDFIPSPDSNRIIIKPRKVEILKYKAQGEGWADVIGNAETPVDMWYFGISYEYQVPKIDHPNNHKAYLTDPMVAASGFYAVRNTEGKIVYGGHATGVPLRDNGKMVNFFTPEDVATNWKAIEAR